MLTEPAKAEKEGVDKITFLPACTMSARKFHGGNGYLYAYHTLNVYRRSSALKKRANKKQRKFLASVALYHTSTYILTYG